MADEKPHRVQLSRRKNWRMPPNSVSVGRPTRYGNPHRIGLCPICGAQHSRGEAVAKLRAEIAADPELQAKIRRDLAGKNLACWCPLSAECHADVLLEYANKQEGR